ncbi:MAG: hypothetical protein ABSB12_01350 [Candidatus Saccharimonadales bacterium]|jgi:hypothetical protein
MSEQIIRLAKWQSDDSNMRRDFIKRMHRKLELKQEFYRDGDKHRFISQNLSLPVDYSL